MSSASTVRKPGRRWALCYRSRVDPSLTARVSRFTGLLAFALTASAGCAPREPPSWPEGGSVLALAPARWDRPGEDTIEIRADGHVLEDGDLLFVIDRVGRVVDEDYDPLAILLPDGRAVGTDHRLLGQVGVTNAAPPWSAHAWLAVMPDGTVTFFEPDGDREFGGRWHGCAGPVLRTCTLVSHLVALRNYRPPDIGIGIGVGVGIGF